MKKKTLGLVLVIVFILSMSVSVFAGDHENPSFVKPDIKAYSVVGAPNN